MKKEQKTLIWRFYTEGSSKMNYLLGTMHVTDNQAFAFEQNMKKRLLECAIFATEFNLDDADYNTAQAAMMLPTGQTLSEILTKKLYEKTGKFLKKRLNEDISNYEYFKPIMFSKLITDVVLSNDQLLPLDDMLFQFARENDRILRGVETFEEQIIILNKMSLKSQIKSLKDMIGGFSKVRRELLKTAELYAEGDLKSLYKTAKGSVKSNRQLMITDRNALMARRIAEMSAENTVCAAIGAGHLWGEKGVLNGLRKLGFKVEPQ
ncbi:MAG: TraB/GumN family protein [Saprospiraceae bacterium]|nr:TraB/GumN family protein [Saprospiraceae bacterium]